MAIVASPVMAGAEPREADFSSQIEAIPMAWRVEQEDDAGSGERSCFLISWGGDVIVRLHKPNPAEAATWSVMIGIDSQPGSVHYLRINRRYFTTAEPGFRGSEAEEIVQLLKSPGEFSFEWAKSPDHSKRQGLFGTGDFAAKAAECERWVDQTQSTRVAPARSKSRSDDRKDMRSPREASSTLDLASSRSTAQLTEATQRLLCDLEAHVRGRNGA